MRKEVIGDSILYLGDCIDVLSGLRDGCQNGDVSVEQGRGAGMTLKRAPIFDAVITDPPYGIGFKYATHDDSPELWFDLMNKVVPICKEIAKFVIMPSCQVKRLDWWYANHKPEWIVAWHKGSPGHVSTIGFNDWEPHVCWGRPKRPMHDHFSTACGFDDNGHPCPKPVAYTNWLVSRGAAKGGTVIDPFMGSGTTGVSCMNLGRKFVGIEIDPKYFDIACERIENAQRQEALFA